MKNKKKKLMLQHPISIEEISSLRKLNMAFFDHFEEEKINMYDPLDNYIYKLRSRICGDPKLFNERFVKGFEILVEQISKEGIS